jgi:hypothetical protein
LPSVFASQGIELFPGSWDEVDADCSCPDWVNPYKHLAAVFYVLAQEIDIDPFILFSLRGLTKEELMESACLACIMREYSNIGSDDKLCLSFFGMADFRPEKFEERKTAKAVADWLGSLSGFTGRFGPLVRIELPAGRQKKFRFFLDVEDREDPLVPPVPLASLFAGEDAFCRPAGEVLSMVARQVAAAAGYCPELKNMLANKGQRQLSFAAAV